MDASRDKDTSKILRATINCREVIIVSTGSAPEGGAPQPQGNPGSSMSRSASKSYTSDSV